MPHDKEHILETWEKIYIKTGLPAGRLAYVSKAKQQSVFFRLKECVYWSNHISSNAASSGKL